MVFGEIVRVDKVTTDRYGRIIGKVYLGKAYINEAMVRRGHAWVYRRYSKDPELVRLEGFAKAGKRGLWAQANPTPPWLWRRQRR